MPRFRSTGNTIAIPSTVKEICQERYLDWQMKLECNILFVLLIVYKPSLIHLQMYKIIYFIFQSVTVVVN